MLYIGSCVEMQIEKQRDWYIANMQNTKFNFLNEGHLSSFVMFLSDYKALRPVLSYFSLTKGLRQVLSCFVLTIRALPSSFVMFLSD